MCIRDRGYGDEKPELFNPSDVDADDLGKTLADAGFKGVVLTCKHHDGFCLWPTKTTQHSVCLLYTSTTAPERHG